MHMGRLGLARPTPCSERARPTQGPAYPYYQVPLASDRADFRGCTIVHRLVPCTGIGPLPIACSAYPGAQPLGISHSLRSCGAGRPARVQPQGGQKWTQNVKTVQLGIWRLAGTCVKQSGFSRSEPMVEIRPNLCFWPTGASNGPQIGPKLPVEGPYSGLPKPKPVHWHTSCEAGWASALRCCASFLEQFWGVFSPTPPTPLVPAEFVPL